MVLRNLIFDTEVVEQRLRTVLLPHHKQPASEIGDCLQHHSLSSAYNLALVALASTNSVTFSTATLDFTHCPGKSRSQLNQTDPWLDRCFALLTSALSSSRI